MSNLSKEGQTFSEQKLFNIPRGFHQTYGLEMQGVATMKELKHIVDEQISPSGKFKLLNLLPSSYLNKNYCY